MQKAQKRDAVRSEKFYFRKNVFSSAERPSSRSLRSSGSSSCGSSVPSTPQDDCPCPCGGANFSLDDKKVLGGGLGNGLTNGFVRPKVKKMRNCFPAPPKPETDRVVPVEDEYELMSIEEIMVGKVRGVFSSK